MTSFLRFVLFGFSGLFFSAGVYAAGDVIQFSADAVQQAPDRPPMNARIYIGENAVRNEYEINGQQFVEILRHKEKESMLLNPERKEYVVRPGSQFVSPQLSKKKVKDSSPCEGVPNVRCEKKGEETLSSRSAEKWEFITTENGREFRSLVWIDTQRRFPVKQMFPDGSMFEMTFMAKEKIGGRSTEKWEVIHKRPDGYSSRAWQWHDTVLHIAIREELPGGFLRELKNIKEGKQPAKLFDVPEGYKRIQPPAYSGRQPPPQAVMGPGK